MFWPLRGRRDLCERDEDTEEEHDDPHAAAQVALEHQPLDEARALEAREVAVPVVPDRRLYRGVLER